MSGVRDLQLGFRHRREVGKVLWTSRRKNEQREDDEMSIGRRKIRLRIDGDEVCPNENKDNFILRSLTVKHE
jgi:hypothetical protein